MARILIAGCGYLGMALASALREVGHTVVGIRRSPRQSKDAPCEALDLLDTEALASWMATQVRVGGPFDTVVVTIAASRGDETSYRAAYVDALHSLQTRLAATHGRPPLLLFSSSTSVYAQDGGECVDEESATTPRGFRGQIQLEAERLVSSWEGPHAALRLGGLYGPGRTRLLESVREGSADPRRVYTNRIHRDDAAGILAHLVALNLAGQSIPPTLLGVDDAPALRSEVIAWLAATLGVPSPAESSSDEGAARGKRCCNALLRGCGYTFRYPSYREGYAALLAPDAEGAGATRR